MIDPQFWNSLTDDGLREKDVDVDLAMDNLNSYALIVRVRVLLKRTGVGDWRFDNLSGSYLQS